MNPTDGGMTEEEAQEIRELHKELKSFEEWPDRLGDLAVKAGYPWSDRGIFQVKNHADGFLEAKSQDRQALKDKDEEIRALEWELHSSVKICGCRLADVRCGRCQSNIEVLSQHAPKGKT